MGGPDLCWGRMLEHSWETKQEGFACFPLFCKILFVGRWKALEPFVSTCPQLPHQAFLPRLRYCLHQQEQSTRQRAICFPQCDTPRLWKCLREGGERKPGAMRQNPRHTYTGSRKEAPLPSEGSESGPVSLKDVLSG